MATAAELANVELEARLFVVLCMGDTFEYGHGCESGLRFPINRIRCWYGSVACILSIWERV